MFVDVCLRSSTGDVTQVGVIDIYPVTAYR